ncbi:MAG: S8 family serine peptidase [Calditrichia bacterium]
MLRRSFYSIFLFFTIFCLTGLASGPLSSEALQKLHPYFQKVLAHAYSSLNLNLPQPEASILANSAGQPLYPAIIYLQDSREVREQGVHLNSVYDNFVTAQLTPAQMLKLVPLKSVRYIDRGTRNRPVLNVSVPQTGAYLVHNGAINGVAYEGESAIVFVYDSGIDWKHLAFRDPGDTTKSRILAIWDQTLTPQGSEHSPTGFNYGVEYTQAEINNELDGTPANFVRTEDIEGHGTHVTGIAAGNAAYSELYIGVAPKADIIMVKGGDASFSEAQAIDGLTYAQNKSTEFGEPVAVNWSFGSQVGPHDGTLPYEIAANQFSQQPGRVVSIAAGNEGADNIHVSGSIASGSSVVFQMDVPGYTPSSSANNDEFLLDIWYNGTETVTATVKSPNNISLEMGPGNSGTGPNSSDGTIDLANVTSTINGQKNIFLDVYDANASTPPASGTWTLTLSGASGTIAYDGWLGLNTVGNATVTVAGGNNNKTVGMPATAQQPVAVGSYVTKWYWSPYSGGVVTYDPSTYGIDAISNFSSIGPTRDNRQKPDIAAPGQGIAAPKSNLSSPNPSFVLAGQEYVIEQGTSMAAPHITGTAALFLGNNPSLTSADFKTAITGNTDTDLFTGTVPNYVWGYGKLDVFKSLYKTVTGSQSQRTILAYEKNLSQSFNPAPSRLLALRFTPTFSGRVTGMFLRLGQITGSGPLHCAVYTNTSGSLAGIPGTMLGKTVDVPFERFILGSYNYIDLMGAEVDVMGGTDYQLVVSWDNASDNLIFMGGNQSVSEHRSSINKSGTWYNLGDPASGTTALDLSLRIEVTDAAGLNAIASSVVQKAETFELFQNFPNPFNPATKIRYWVPEHGKITLTVFDILGKKVKTLVNREQPAGEYEVNWDGTDERQNKASTGVYFYRLGNGQQIVTRKMLLIR